MQPTRERLLQRRETGELETETASLNSVELQRAKDGTYYWTHKRYYRPDESLETVLDDLRDMDARLKSVFLGCDAGG